MYSQLRLLLPNAGCNLNCKYCLSHLSTQKQNPDLILNEEKILSLIDGDFKVISIWGGEPLFKFEWFKKLIEFCKKNFPDKPIHVLSNGYLLNEEVVDILNENDINFAISHDGVGQSYRGKDFLQEDRYLKLIKSIKNFGGFHTVIHNFNCNCKKNFEYFENIKQILEMPRMIYSFGKFKLDSPELLKFVPQGKSLITLDQSYKFLLKMYDMRHPFAGSLHFQLLHYAKILEHPEKHTDVTELSCGAHNRPTIRTDGIRFHCQVAGETNRTEPVNFKLSQACEECEYKLLCKGICPLESLTYKSKLCIVYKLWYKNVVEYFKCVNEEVPYEFDDSVLD